MRTAARILSKFFMLFFFASAVFAEKISLEFRNQKTSDILFALGEMAGVSVMMDESVSGISSFIFNDEDFESAVRRFCDHESIHWKSEGGVYIFSKIMIERTGDGVFTVDAEEVSPALFVRKFSKESGITVMNDPFPNITATVRLKNESAENILNLLVSRYDGYELFEESGGFFIRKTSGARRQDGRHTVRMKEGLMDVSASRTQLGALLSDMFERAGAEFVLLSKNNPTLESVRYSGKRFDDVLKLVLEQSGCGFAVKDGIYYVFDVQQKSAAKTLKETYVVRLKNTKAADIMALFPPEMGAGEIVKIDKTTNSLLVTGSPAEADPVVAFIEKIDTPVEGLKYESFSVSCISPEQAVAMLPAGASAGEAAVIPGTSTFVCMTDDEGKARIEEFLESADIKDDDREIRLKYISASELKEHLPASVDKKRITETCGTNAVFFSGNDEQRRNFMDALAVLDRPKDQIRYQLLVVQRQKGGGKKLGTKWNLTNISNSESKDEDTDDSDSAIISSNLSNLIDVSFDVVSQLGFQMAVSLNAELSNNTARIMADTTLNGISGKDISFENKNIFRYRDIITDSDSKTTYTSIVREISTGLSIKINGWVSGDEMVTVSVTADLSKQGSGGDTGNGTIPPSTSEKSVTTSVRTRSGKPIVISGLLQSEADTDKSRVPGLGSIPGLGWLFKTASKTESQTELVIYLTPFVEKEGADGIRQEDNMRTLYEKHVRI